MSVILWPERLGRPMQEGYQRQRNETRQRSAPDRGPRRTNRRTTRLADTVALTLDFDRSEKAIFDWFYEQETEEGLRWFVMPEPTTHGWALKTSDGAPLHTHDGEPILLSRWQRCQFGDQQPAETVYGVRFRISFTLDVLAW